MANSRSFTSALTVLLTVLSLCLFISFSPGEPKGSDIILGTWKSYEQGAEIVFAFSKDRTCELFFKNKSTGAIEKLNGVFDMDFSKNPIPLNIRKIKQLGYSLHTIVEFKSDHEIRMAAFAPKWRLRPISFDTHNSVYLKRVTPFSEP